MNDRELLEAAARAAGMAGALSWTPGASPWLRVNPDLSRPWNPLTDDGDAFRLAAKLGFDVKFPGIAMNFRHRFEERGEHCAATRRAIVRAAAALDPANQGEE